MSFIPTSTQGSKTNQPVISWTQMFSALRNSNFRIYWIGLTVSLIGTWMQTAATSWMIYRLTNSPLMLGLVNVVYMIPAVPVALFSGVISDRISRKNIVIATDIILLIQALALGLLTVSGKIQIWSLITLNFILGAASAMEQPARLSMIVDIVGKDDITNAVALSSGVLNFSRILGTAMAGLVLAWKGEATCFFINSASYMAAILALLIIHTPDHPRERKQQKLTKSLMSGLKFVWKSSDIRSLMAIVIVTTFFSTGYLLLLTVYARDILHAGPTGQGFLLSSVGIGAVIGALFIANLRSGNRGKWLLWCNIAGSVLLLAFSISHVLSLSLVLICLVGVFNTVRQTLANSLLLIITPDEFQGRVMSIFIILFNGFSNVGNLAVGGLAEYTGVIEAVGLGAILSIFCGILFLIRMKNIRKLA